MLINSSSLHDDQQSYNIGRGLSLNGTKLLADKLAGMSITDLRNLMDVKHMNTLTVKELLQDIRDLTKSLV
jgi:hypothetical protein